MGSVDSSKQPFGVETAISSGHSITAGAVYRPEIDTSSVDEHKLMRRIDFYILPWLALLYVLNFLDRGSIGNAKLYNLERDLGITDQQYLIALTVFFFPYALFEVRMLPLHSSTTRILITLKPVSVFYSDSQKPDYTQESIVFYLSCWYTRKELGSKIAIFFSSATVAGAFSGLLAAAIANMDGVGGKPGWAWIFILEGLITVVLAVVSFWVIQDFPEKAKFLTETERVFIIRRLIDDNQFSAGGEKFSLKYVWQSLTDWKTWVAMGMYMGFDGPLYAFSLFTPTIINQLGFKATKANLLSVPVYAWGCIMTCLVGFLGDRTGYRSIITLALFSIGLTAYIILIVSRNAALSYVAVYLAVSAIYPTIPNAVAWVASNIEGSYKRSVTLGMAIGFGNINGAVAANIYRSKDGPWFTFGHGIVLAYIGFGWICTLIFVYFLRQENARRDRGERDEVIAGINNKHANPKNGIYDSVEAARRDKGDEWSGFRYSL
ncbi:hypothetical protein ONZ45_g3024 [Pleurotus djamor]|nr:hypothetical protein ONZ45_g3024 [Pleurotus djamor]